MSVFLAPYHGVVGDRRPADPPVTPPVHEIAPENDPDVVELKALRGVDAADLIKAAGFSCPEVGLAVITTAFLDHQRAIGNDLITPMPQFRFTGLKPGGRWCVTARNWLRAHLEGAAAPVVLASTHEDVLDIVPLETLQAYAFDVPPDLSKLTDP